MYFFPPHERNYGTCGGKKYNTLIIFNEFIAFLDGSFKFKNKFKYFYQKFHHRLEGLAS